MKNYFLPFIFVLIPSIFFSQSISSALHINEPYKINQKKAIKKNRNQDCFLQPSKSRKKN